MSDEALPARADAPTPGPLLARVDYTVNADDLRVVYSRYYQELYRVQHDVLPLRKRIWLWCAVGAVVLCLSIMLCLHAYGIYTPPTLLIWAILLPGFAAASALVSTREKRQRRADAMVAHAMRTKVVNDFLGNHALWFNDTYVYEQHPGESRGLSWFHIAHVDIDPAFVTFVQTDTRGIYIPVRAFASQADAERFVELARQTLHASGHGDANRIARCLAERDADCPKCKYNLRGTTTGACPECGHPLNRETLPWAFLIDSPPPTIK